MSNSRPRFSICIFAYNSAGSIARAVTSIHPTMCKDFEFVIVDDGSTDETKSVLEGLRLPNLRYVWKEHSGRPESRNRCLAEARGDFIIWIGSDDAFGPGILDRYAQVLEEHPDSDILYGDLMTADSRHRPRRVMEYEDWADRSRDMPAGMVFRNGVPDPGTLVRKELYQRFGGYDPSFPRAQDYEWYARVAGQVQCRHVGMVSVIWRISDSARTNNRPKSTHGARVVNGLLERFSLSRLVPQAGWGQVPDNQAEATARLLLADRFRKLGSSPDALKQLKLVLRLEPGKELTHMAAQLMQAVSNELDQG